MSRRKALMQKIWRALAPTEKDLECNFEVDDDDSSGLLRVGLINHATGSAFEITLSMDDSDDFIRRTIVGALKAAWPMLMQSVRWEDVQ